MAHDNDYNEKNLIEYEGGGGGGGPQELNHSDYNDYTQRTLGKIHGELTHTNRTLDNIDKKLDALDNRVSALETFKSKVQSLTILVVGVVSAVFYAVSQNLTYFLGGH